MGTERFSKHKFLLPRDRFVFLWIPVPVLSGPGHRPTAINGEMGRQSRLEGDLSFDSDDQFMSGKIQVGGECVKSQLGVHGLPVRAAAVAAWVQQKLNLAVGFGRGCLKLEA